MRCPSCSKFVPFGEPEVEVESYSEEVEDEENVTAEVTVSLPCGECGEELKSASLETSVFLPDHVCDVASVLRAMLRRGSTDPTPEEVDKEIEARLFQFDACEAKPLERVEETDAKGKKITNPRYAKKYYGASLTWSGSCSACGEEISLSTDVEEQASAFEEVA